MAKSRFITHGFVLLIVVALSGYASIDRHLPATLSLRLGMVNAQGLVMGQGGEANGVSLGRLSTIIKPVAVPTSPPAQHSPTSYTVAAGEDLGAVASRFGVSVESIRWSNFEALRSTAADVKVGETILVPPVNGVVVTVAEGDTIESLAAAYKVSAQAIVDFNYLRDPARVPAGWRLVIPGGQGPAFETPVLEVAPAPLLRATQVTTAGSSGGGTSSRGGPAPGSQSTAKFPYGYCTWYVASRRAVPWTGDAWQWFGQARAYGYATGSTPRPGAIMVTWESGWGHVAIVESVNPDGSWVVSEMNFVGWGVVSQRTLRPGRVSLIGFIY